MVMHSIVVIVHIVVFLNTCIESNSMLFISSLSLFDNKKYFLLILNDGVMCLRNII